MLVLGIRVPAGNPHKHIPCPESCLPGRTQVIPSENRGSSCSKGPQPPSTQLPGPGPWPRRAWFWYWPWVWTKAFKVTG